MLAADIAKRIDKEKQRLDEAGATPKEIQKHQKALHSLLTSWWPDKYIDGNMIRRAEDGLVPEYEGEQSWLDYKLRWPTDDRKVEK
jgi:hypothetical protein